jgi:hypothetical protein
LGCSVGNRIERPAQTAGVLGLVLGIEPGEHRAGALVDEMDETVQVITAPTVRLDLDADRRNLAETVARLRLLILDPFVRLHRIDENASGEVAPLLAKPDNIRCQSVLASFQRALRPQGSDCGEKAVVDTDCLQSETRRACLVEPSHFAVVRRRVFG